MPAIIAKFGGKVLARGGRYQVMEGPEKFHRFVVIEFSTFEQGVACSTSPEYDRAAAFRRNGAGEVETLMVEGGNPMLQALARGENMIYDVLIRDGLRARDARNDQDNPPARS